ncbi:MAG: energy-coupled thiamine transporter ThiT [Erysipelotrichaceae bacterium]|nr:energy-coupled thiamine transporter ThiT [Erysipelotrichaceae bacterium]
MKNKTRELVLIAMFIALAIVLDYVKEMLPFLNMPQGGSVNIALIPVVVGSFVLGWKKGLFIGFMWWLLTFVLGLNRWFISIPQYLLDYIVPSCIVGISSIFYKKKTVVGAVAGIVLAMVIRTLSIIISGAIYWPGDAASNSAAAWAGSFAYNLPYSIATAIMLVIVTPLILKAIKKYL